MRKPKSKRVSRLEAARLLGVSRSHVQKLTASGQLPAKRDAMGFYSYDVTDLQDFAFRRQRAAVSDGEKARGAFKMFKEGASLADVVIATALPPHEVYDLWEWFRFGFALPEMQRKQAAAEQAELEHEAELRKLDEQIEQQRKRMQGSANPPPSKAPSIPEDKMEEETTSRFEREFMKEEWWPKSLRKLRK